MKIGKLNFEHTPILLAPMEDVTDPPFRSICKAFGADIVYTEFISSEGLVRGASKSIKKLSVFDEERPVAIQIFGNDVHAMVEAALIAEKANPDFIDINFGCPAKKVAGRGAGSGLLCTPNLLQELATAVVNAVSLPVTAKTRIGWDDTTISIYDTVKRMEDAGVRALTIHGRTRAQMFKGKADWSWIARAKEAAHIPIIGNGDIWTAEDAHEKLTLSNVDALMVGRGSIGNPFIFREIKHLLNTGIPLAPPTPSERVSVAVQHLTRSIQWKGEKYGVLEMRKHYSTYFKGLPNVSLLRNQIITETNPDIIISKLNAFESECVHYYEKSPLSHASTNIEYLNDHSNRLILQR